jgi:ribonuclease HII
MGAGVDANMELEASLGGAGTLVVAGIDEVGRGALAGPVSVGVVAVRTNASDVPPGLRDSKLLTKSKRERLLAGIMSWSEASAVGDASNEEIDTVGITRALALAGTRALEQLGVEPQHIILDGNFDWLAAGITTSCYPKADQNCASVAAASVVAKCHRDSIMRELSTTVPGYGWDTNVGYGSAKHKQAIRTIGTSAYHRASWNLY